MSVILTLVGIALFALFAVYAERKVSAFIQDRLGPMEVGPYGIAQTFADILKMVQKELFAPSAADKWLYFVAPVVVFASVAAAFSAVPFGENLAGTGTHLSLYLLLAVAGIDVIGILMAGLGSNNKYAMLGAARAVAQIVAYEVPAALTVLAAAMMFGSLNLDEIAQAQQGGIHHWAAIRYPHLLLAFAVYFVASLAECNRTPFDLPEAESELVAGYHTEYGGFLFAIFMLSEYGKMLLVSLLAATLFWGGWTSPLPNIGAAHLCDWTTGGLWGFGWLMAKALLLVLLQMWARWAYPRLRIDQLMALCWKYLVPMGLVLFFISGLIKMW